MDNSPFESISDDYRCWACGCSITESNGVSLADTDELHACSGCWDQVPVTHRFWLGLLFRRLDAGGFGIQDMLEEALRQLPAMRSGYRGDRMN